MPFRECTWMGGGVKKVPLAKICHTYSTMMKRGTVIPYLNKKGYDVTIDDYEVTNKILSRDSNCIVDAVTPIL